MIAISITTHENPRVIMELLSNINLCYNGNAFLVVHVSSDHKEAFYRHAAATGVRLFAENIFWNDAEISTKWGNTLPMQIWNYLYLKTQVKQSFSHFQILSPANLIIRRNMDQHVKAHDVIMRNATTTENGWMWRNEAHADPQYRLFCEANGISQYLCARIDGLAARDDIFGDFVRRILATYSISDMQNINPTYPQEETILPTYLNKLKEFSFSFGEHFAKTFEPNEPQLSTAIVEQLVNDGKVAYLKRIAPQADDPVRRHILRQFSSGRRR